MYNYMDAGSSVISVIFFIATVIIGAFFTMNLVLATVVDAFNNATEEQKRLLEQELEEEEDEKLRTETVVEE